MRGANEHNRTILIALASIAIIIGLFTLYISNQQSVFVKKINTKEA
jgi:hypothetical protein